jgi:hypothetical protein
MFRIITFSLLCVALFSSTKVEASSRKIPWLYEPRTMPAGHVEYEQWVTLKTNKESDSKYTEVRFRHEIEWGVTDRFQMAVYVADWRYKKTSSGERTSFRDVALEGIYQLQAPNPDQLGVALYGEIKYGSEFLELEAKILLEAEFDQVNVIYNFTLEAEWEGQDLQEDKGKIINSIALTYQPKPSFTLGLQAILETPIPDWEDFGDEVLSIGPSVSWQSGSWWCCVSPIFQVTNVDSAPDLQVRFLFGIDF